MSKQMKLFENVPATGTSIAVRNKYSEISSVANSAKARATAKTETDSSAYSFKLTERSLTNIYANSAIARQIIDAPANDAVAKWRTWDAEQEIVDAIALEERRLEIQPKLIEALAVARLHRGCAILIGTGEKDYSLPLDVMKIAKGGLTHLTVMPRYMFSNIDFQNDVGFPNYREPTMFHTTLPMLTENGNTKAIKVHPSRLIVIRGERILSSVGQMTMEMYWGDSILQNRMNGINDLESSFDNTAVMMFEARTPVLAIEGVLARAAEENAKVPGSGDVRAAEIFNAFNTAKGNTTTTIIDKGTMEYSVNEFNFTGIPAIIQGQIERVAGESGIPISILFGKQVTGLGNSGLGDRLNYFQMLSSLQELKLRPALRIFDMALARSAIEGFNDGISYTWNDLGEITDIERSAIFRSESQGIRDLVKERILTEDEGRLIIQKLLKTSGLAIE